MRNKAGTGELLAIPIFCFIMSLLFFWVIRSQRNLSLIQKYHKSITESSANGLTNLSVFMAVFIINLLIFVSGIFREVSIIYQANFCC